MNETKVNVPRQWSASELRQLPAVERDAVLSAAAALAEREYRDNAALTVFEAFGERDIHGHSSDTQAR
jgi:hypothetical protein